jgi:hypothetical protein
MIADDHNALTLLARAARHGACCVKNTCRNCGAHVSSYNCNSGLVKYRPEGEACDYWAACDNALCSHAYGTGYYADLPSWVSGSGLHRYNEDDAGQSGTYGDACARSK